MTAKTPANRWLKKVDKELARRRAHRGSAAQHFADSTKEAVRVAASKSQEARHKRQEREAAADRYSTEVVIPAKRQAEQLADLLDVGMRGEFLEHLRQADAATDGEECLAHVLASLLSLKQRERLNLKASA